MKIAIVGSRNYANLKQVEDLVDRLPDWTEVISGGAYGVDKTAEVRAKARGLQTLIFYPDWKSFGKSAGPLRNSRIVEACDKLVAFWDGFSKGTYDSINKAMKAGKLLAIIGIGDKIEEKIFFPQGTSGGSGEGTSQTP